MPCRSDYMEPSRAEENSNKVARFLVYVQTELGFTPDSDYKQAATNAYGNVSKLEEFTQDLCQILTTLEQTDKPELERIVYDAHKAMSRNLANWWEEHKAADEKRLAREKREREKQEADDYAEYLRLKEKFEE